ncbi:hypothetical protein M378DRAFT_326166 [Amanita muscaria Koide BX008]|uniref:polynucleotide adenylyltransferase n=1 Tax=Amanita muscaria (strain Koide BX008) TaxID=946122 RepID=A0A0C2TJB5_AMAMK|nr:hypothetical protein M378DRAFT_326166 [Amanita muscaria Koide BX008]
MVFDFNDGYLNKKQRSSASSRRAPWLNQFNWESCKNVAEMLHREVEAFTNWISPTPVEHEVRQLVVTLITKTIRQSFSDAQVFAFGSYETRLYLPLGDIDLVVMSESMAYSNRQTVLYALANALKRSGITTKVTVIARAKVPIVKFVTTHGRINVDISVNQQNGIVSGGIINEFLKDMHAGGRVGKGNLALRSLVLITKAFLGQRSMNEVYTGGLGSYSIVCMAISFLQMHPKIRRGEIDPDKNLGVLLMEFFELYGCYFNYEEAGISVRNDGFYFKKRQRGWVDYQKSDLVSIEDPADPSNDISKGSFGFHRVRMTFAGAHGILTSSAYLKAGILNSRRDDRSYRLRDHYEAQDMSILSSVIGITQETVNQRRLVQDVYDNRALHRLVGGTPKPTVVQDVSETTVSKEPPRSAESSATKRAISFALEEDDGDQLNDWAGRHLDEEEGRYHIGRRQVPPHKRRKTEKMADLQTDVFTTDDEAEDMLLSSSEVEDQGYPDVKEEGGRYNHMPASSEKVGKRRSFWLSKGKGIPDTDDDDKGW